MWPMRQKKKENHWNLMSRESDSVQILMIISNTKKNKNLKATVRRSETSSVNKIRSETRDTPLKKGN